MKNIDNINAFKTTIQETDFGVITRLVADVEVSAKDSILFGAKTLMTNYVYNENGTYNLIYTIIDTDGVTESFAEDNGILPTLFLSP
ncbi:hypothetical protein ACR79B_05420 [Sphingobacterium spiritivorum]